MINRAVLVGRLTKEPDLRYTASSVAVVSFTVAVNRQFTNSQGEREADFINCIMWRKAAENFANFTHKGSLVGIDGRIQTRSYENQEGQRVYVTEVVADNFSLLESRAQSEQYKNNNSNSQSTSQAPTSNQSRTPSSQESISSSQHSNPFDNTGQPINISDDDLLF